MNGALGREKNEIFFILWGQFSTSGQIGIRFPNSQENQALPISKNRRLLEADENVWHCKEESLQDKMSKYSILSKLKQQNVAHICYYLGSYFPNSSKSVFSFLKWISIKSHFERQCWAQWVHNAVTRSFGCRPRWVEANEQIIEMQTATLHAKDVGQQSAFRQRCPHKRRCAVVVFFINANTCFHLKQ